jgi:hypothetical protein
MNKASSFFIIIIMLIFFGCTSTQTFNYIERERLNIYENAEKILLSLGYENPIIFVYFHSNIEGSVLSKETYRTTYEGTGFNPEVPVGSELNDMPGYDDISTMHGRVEQRVLKANYDSRIKTEIIYSYVSVLIIIDEISVKKREELIKIFRMYLLNNDRNDEICIVSRKDF